MEFQLGEILPVLTSLMAMTAALLGGSAAYLTYLGNRERDGLSRGVRSKHRPISMREYGLPGSKLAKPRPSPLRITGWFVNSFFVSTGALFWLHPLVSPIVDAAVDKYSWSDAEQREAAFLWLTWLVFLAVSFFLTAWRWSIEQEGKTRV